MIAMEKTACPLVGFLVSSGSDMGRAIELLRQYARETRQPYIRDLAERMNDIPIGIYDPREVTR
jgi:DNA-binding transcriptional regulator YbjK